MIHDYVFEDDYDFEDADLIGADYIFEDLDEEDSNIRLYLEDRAA